MNINWLRDNWIKLISMAISVVAAGSILYSNVARHSVQIEKLEVFKENQLGLNAELMTELKGISITLQKIERKLEKSR